MKKLLIMMISAVFVLLCLTACGAQDEEQTTTEQAGISYSGAYSDDSDIPLEVGDRVE